VAQCLGEHVDVARHALALRVPQRERDLEPLALVPARVGVDGPRRRDEDARGLALGAGQRDARTELVAEGVGRPLEDALGTADRAPVQLGRASEHERTVASADVLEVIRFVRGRDRRRAGG
jgi:hypothetical protein